MKNYLKSVLFFAALAAVMPCKGNTPPCQGENSKSTKELIRATGIFSATQAETAKKLLDGTCINSMKKKIRKSLDILVPNYYNSKKQTLSDDAKTKLQNFDLEVPATKTICEGAEPNGKSQKLYRVVEVGFEQIAKPVHTRLVNDKILPKGYDYKTFSEDFYKAIQQVENK